VHWRAADVSGRRADVGYACTASSCSARWAVRIDFVIRSKVVVRRYEVQRAILTASDSSHDRSIVDVNLSSLLH